eukprot:259731-Chlamydomonas_euryale.AAC.13
MYEPLVPVLRGEDTCLSLLQRLVGCCWREQDAVTSQLRSRLKPSNDIGLISTRVRHHISYGASMCCAPSAVVDRPSAPARSSSSSLALQMTIQVAGASIRDILPSLWVPRPPLEHQADAWAEAGGATVLPLYLDTVLQTLLAVAKHVHNIARVHSVFPAHAEVGRLAEYKATRLADRHNRCVVVPAAVRRVSMESHAATPVGVVVNEHTVKADARERLHGVAHRSHGRRERPAWRHRLARVLEAGTDVALPRRQPRLLHCARAAVQVHHLAAQRDLSDKVVQVESTQRAREHPEWNRHCSLKPHG